MRRLPELTRVTPVVEADRERATSLSAEASTGADSARPLAEQLLDLLWVGVPEPQAIAGIVLDMR